MPYAILYLAEGKGAGCGGHVDNQNQCQRAAGREPHDLLRVHCRESDDCLDSGLIEHDADKESRQVAIAARVGKRIP